MSKKKFLYDNHWSFWFWYWGGKGLKMCWNQGWSQIYEIFMILKFSYYENFRIKKISKVLPKNLNILGEKHSDNTFKKWSNKTTNAVNKNIFKVRHSLLLSPTDKISFFLLFSSDNSAFSSLENYILDYCLSLFSLHNAPQQASLDLINDAWFYTHHLLLSEFLITNNVTSVH
jgi:hypothetical protein